MAFYVYIVRTDNNLLYIGQSNNLERRGVEHGVHHHGAKYLCDNKSSFRIVYTEVFDIRIEAMRREKQLKGWTRAKKEALISGDLTLLKGL